MSHVLEIINLTKYYGKIRALHEVKFEVPEGTIFGILGPNGSGKTTMLGIIMDVLKPSSGSINILGAPSQPEIRKKIGTLLETPNFYHYLNALDNLKIIAEIKGIDQPDFDKVLHKVNLYERRHSPFSSFSLGMKQRLAIAACLLGNPEMLVFDEPTNGLDPAGIAEIRDLIRQLAKEGKTIIMASHMLDEVEKVCTHVAILKKGTLLATGPVEEILAHEDIVVAGSDDAEKLESILKKMPGQTGVYPQEGGLVNIHFPQGKANLTMVNQFCFENGLILGHLTQKRKSLETKFIELTN